MAVNSFVVLGYVWIVGTVISTLCLIVQGALPFFKRTTLTTLAHVDQTILTQLAVARLVATFIELFVTLSTTYMENEKYMKDALGGVYLYMVTVLVCLMFLYANNLRDQVLSTPASRRWKYSTMFLLSWLSTAPVAILYFSYFCFEITEYATTYLKVYVGLLVLVMTCNILFYFGIIIRLYNRSHINLRNIIVKIVISFVLVCLTNVSIILKYFTNSEPAMYFLFVFNSFQVLAMTIMFVLPVRTSNAV